MPSPHLARYLETRAPNFAEAIAQTAPHDNRLEYLIEKLIQVPEHLDSLDNDRELRACTLDVFNHSRYFADQLVRYPELLHEIAQACGDRQGRLGFQAPEDMAELRRYFREQMTRIQADSIYHRAPIFKTLKRTSQLAESIILAAYRIATREAMETAPPGDSGLPSRRPDDDHRAGTPGNARVRPRLGRRSGLRHPRRRCAPRCVSGRPSPNA